MKNSFWDFCARDLGIVVSHNAILPGIEFLGVFDTHLRCFGSKNGMIVTTDFEKISKHLDTLAANGYGYSVIDFNEKYDRESAIDLFRDWTWTCANSPPEWY